MVYLTAKFKNAGKSLDETLKFIEDIKLHVIHNFTVYDLAYLAKSGRLSKGSAFMDNLMNINPVSLTDGEGRLVPLYKVKGRKKSLEEIVNDMEKRIGGYKKQ